MNPYYVAGGTLHPEAECYIERDADRELFDGLLKGEFCYVLTSRQMGKSSLMARTAFKLRKRGFEVVMIDLTAVGQNVSCEQWYDGLIMQVAEQLDLEDEVEDFWEEQERLSPIQRFIRTLNYVVLESIGNNLIIFIDEIDVVLSLPFSADELFGAIRECYNRRTREPKFQRLDFCLLGVASPVDLINNTSFSPFNSGRAITLCDFSLQDTEDLGAGLGGEQGSLWYISHQIYMWTKGHPYLTLRLYKAMAALPAINGIEDVDAQCKELFLKEKSMQEDANLIFVNSWLLRSQVEQILVETLDLIRSLVSEKKVVFDSSNVIQKVVVLSGVALEKDGRLVIRNPIYQRVIGDAWQRRHLPRNASYNGKQDTERWLRWQPYLRAVGTVVVVVLVFGFLVSQLLNKTPQAIEDQRSLASPGGAQAMIENGNRAMETDAVPVEDYKPSNNEMVILARAIWELNGKVMLDDHLLGRDPYLTHIEGSSLAVYFEHTPTIVEASKFSQIPFQDRIGAAMFTYSPFSDAHLEAMSGWVNMSGLDFTQTQVSDEGLKRLSHLPSLSRVRLSNLTANSIGIMANSVPKLEELWIHDSTINRRTLSGLNSLPVKSFRVSNCPFESTAWEILAAHPDVADFRLFHYLDIRFPYESLNRLTHLTELELTHVTLDKKAFEAISNIPNLKKLTIFGEVRTDPENYLILLNGSLEQLVIHPTNGALPESIAETLRSGPINDVDVL